MQKVAIAFVTLYAYVISCYVVTKSEDRTALWKLKGEVCHVSLRAEQCEIMFKLMRYHTKKKNCGVLVFASQL